MLVLFDIDGTMLSSEGIGVRSINEAVSALHGVDCTLEGIPVGGRLDPLIWDDICEKYDIPCTKECHDDFRSLYTKTLLTNIQDVTVRILPGVSELIDALVAMDNVTLGVVTGNYKETGTAKIIAAGFAPFVFTANAWGTDGAIRAELPPVAIAQSEQHEQVVLLGDTVHDITSGQSAGCRVIAVCTGSHDRATLEASSPELLLEDLSDTKAILHWIFNTQNL